MTSIKQRFQNPYFKKNTADWLQWSRDWWVYLGIGLLLSLLAWHAVAQKQWLWIDSIQIKGNQYLKSDQVQTAVASALDKKHWLIIPQRLWLFTDEKKLTTDITTELEHTIGIAQLSVTTNFPDAVVVQLKERVPGYVYIVNEQYFYVDESGIVTSEVDGAELDPHFPHIRDRNKKRKLQLEAAALPTETVDFIAQLVDRFTAKTHIDISEFTVLPISCQEKQYVADKIFADEIKGTKDESVKQQKRDILKRLQNNDITVDQSLSLLEEIKRNESGNSTTTNESQAIITWEAQYVDTDCDYSTIIQDIGLITQPGVEIYLDSTMNIDEQLDQLVFVLENEDIDLTNTQYIDIRFDDRVYYK